jgi:PEP-CTERM motif
MSGGAGGAASMAIATGGAGGGSAFRTPGAGGAATADSDSNSGGTGNATSTAEATGGPGGDGPGAGGGGTATASSNATSNAGDATSTAAATGGQGGDGEGVGGTATASTNAISSLAGNATSTAEATGGAGGGLRFDVVGGNGGNGGNADAISTATSNGTGNASSSANSKGGAGGDVTTNFSGKGGDGGDATAMAIATAAGGGTAIANSVATGGVGGIRSTPGATGSANATSTATTAKGALAQAQSTALGSSGKAQSTALTSYSFVKVQSAAVAQVGSTATTNAIAQGGGSGQAFVNPGQTLYAFSTALPDKAYAATLIGGASHVTSALLGPRDQVFGTAILGANYASDGGGESDTYSASSTFDFGYGGDLQLGLIDDQLTGFANGLGFQSMEFTIEANGVEILDTTFRSLAIAESFFRDDAIDLGSNLGPNIDLTFGYTLIADGAGGFGFGLAIGGAVPEPSTWALMLVGFAGIGFYRSAKSRTRYQKGPAERASHMP